MKDKYSELNYSLNEIFNDINQRTPFIDQNILKLKIYMGMSSWLEK